ncbi:3-mercaptopyruvate sulfurtransferase [Rhodococcus ruber BKS 20-38]|uniref:3-mercaptopyruvate sulfurtransferase n=1 Tax=Rhodococcus ruber BKS 20-38 TaxID=1278076 RepID=M2XQV4_9NOCA|nr:3-mercaptopyruvate sulfurtransferase [Rhodococcus ruber]EME51530.1 3-mercaptopyruvate sulfurtransferase [Rhodococcus ruber BKS 20-38]
MTYPGPVVSADWLRNHLDDPDVRVVDASVHLPDTGRDARAEYLQAHIPGALMFDLNEIADPDNPLPRKVPPAELFAKKVRELGIGNETHVVAYDTLGLYSAARVWWLFRLYGHTKVSILDGGLKAWQAHNLAVESGENSAEPTSFTIREQADLLVRSTDVLEVSRNGNEQILDARTSGRFAGTEQDRYPGTRPGHIPNSLNLYWAELLDPDTRMLLPVEQIRSKIDASGVTGEKPIVLTCGSGLTACILALGLHLSGNDRWRVYDGSWDEWGRNHNLPVAEGAPLPQS